MAEPSIILCGSLRAGTTLTRVLLQQHKEIIAPGESDYYFDGLTSALDQDDTDSGRAAYRERIRLSRQAAAQSITLPNVGPIREMIQNLADQQTPASGQLMLTLHRHFDVAAAAFPNAMFIHLRRDPRDVAISAMKMGWSGNPYHGVACWEEAETSWSRATALLAADRQIDLAFEDMTANPEGELSRVLDRLSLGFDAAVLDPKGTTYSAPTTGRNQAWKGVLSERESAEINARIAYLAETCGYDLTPQATPSALRRLQLKGESWIGRQHFRVQRYGAGLWLKDHIARRFGSPAQRESVLRQIQAVDIEHLK